MTLAPRTVLRARLLAAALLASTALTVGAPDARAQSETEFIPSPPSSTTGRKSSTPAFMSSSALSGVGTGERDPNARMLLEAKELIYDYNKEVVTAVGNVDIYYEGRAVQANRVVYDQRNNRVRAMGNVKLTEPGGNVVYGETLDLTDDFRDGFVESLRIETPDRTRFAATRAQRSEGKLSVFDRGVYTACEACREDPSKPPLWQIKAKRIIYREDEKMIYYEDATFELFGYSVAYLPFFSHPDPSVKRKSGILSPRYSSSSRVGIGVEVPYFFVLAPNMDATLAPMVTSKQGVMMKGEFRHRLIDGSYMIRAAGISQANSHKFRDRLIESDPNSLTIGSGDKDNRWQVQTKGDFDINHKWSWGWDINLLSDKFVRNNYDLWGNSRTATSQLYLSGQGDRSWFDLRAYRFYGMTRFDQQDRLPWAAPVLDYNYVYDKPVFDGELAFNINATSIYREDSDFARSRTRLNPKDNALVGVGGEQSRISGDAQWRRQFIDPAGQVWTPFAFLRGDMIYSNPDENLRTAPFLDHDQDVALRGSAGVGLEYRYPFIAVNAFGTHQIEPIGQIIFRPNETEIGSLANEDAQSLMFDDTTLFAWDKFSGYDRIEGGSRANVGVQYTLTTPGGAVFNVMGGQSYHLFGKNSFAASLRDPTRTGTDSGLDTDRSDYVAGFTALPTKNFALASHFRLDKDSLKVRVAEVEGRARLGRFQGNLVYGRYDEQPDRGYEDVREGVLAGARVFVTPNVYVAGGARYNFDYKEFDRTQIGFGVNNIEDCVSLAFDYIRDYNVSTNLTRPNEIDHKFLLKVDFRTLGEVGVSTNVSNDDGFGTEERSMGVN